MTKLGLVLWGIRSTQSKNRSSGRTRLPITLPILRKIREVWNEDPTNFDYIMLWAASTLCFFGFFRSGEITTTSDSSYDPRSHLSLNDIAVDNPAAPSILQVHLKVSKMDPFRKGIDVYIGCTSNDLCPVAAMMAYLAVRGNTLGALFRFKDGRLLSRFRFVERIRAALARSGLDHLKYAGHSFRSGAATTAAQCGLNDATIKLLGRWQSCAYLLYVKTRPLVTSWPHFPANSVIYEFKPGVKDNHRYSIYLVNIFCHIYALSFSVFSFLCFGGRLRLCLTFG